MDFNKYDYVEPKGVNGKILITSFPSLDENGIFQEVNFQTLLNVLQKNNCSSITSFVEDKEFNKLCNKKQFIENIYKHNIKWYHLPISDLSAPESEFKHQWQTKKVLLKKELITGRNILLHCYRKHNPSNGNFTCNIPLHFFSSFEDSYTYDSTYYSQ